MKIYLAAPYHRKDEIKKYAISLRGFNIEVTSTWLDEPHSPTTEMRELSHEQHQKYAIKDVDDVVIADGLVIFTDPTQSIVRQGRTAEMGMAIAINRMVRPMPIFVVGNLYENIFHHMTDVQHFEDWDTTKKAVLNFARQFDKKLIVEQAGYTIS